MASDPDKDKARAIGKQRWEYYVEHQDELNAAAQVLYFAGEPWELTPQEASIQRERTAEHTNRSMAYTKAVDGLPAMASRLYSEGHNPGFHLETIEALFAPLGRTLHPSEKQDVLKALGECGWERIRITRNQSNVSTG
jgi:hypothetical protein